MRQDKRRCDSPLSPREEGNAEKVETCRDSSLRWGRAGCKVVVLLSTKGTRSCTAEDKLPTNHKLYVVPGQTLFRH